MSGYRGRGEDVVAVMERLKGSLGRVPRRLLTDNGSEFISKLMDRWAYEKQVTMDFPRPAKTTDNAFIKSFNGSLRDVCLNVHWFLSLEHAQKKSNNGGGNTTIFVRILP